MVFALFWFCMVILLAGVFTPGYSHLHQAISELAAPGAPLAFFVQYGGFVPLGLMFILFAISFLKIPGEKNLQNSAFVLFTLTGLALIVAGIFPTEQFGRRNTLPGMLHAIAGIILIVLVCLTPIILAITAKTRPVFRLYSLLTGLLLILLFIFLPNGISPTLIKLHKIVLGDFFDAWYAVHGLQQRALFLLYFIWLTLFVRTCFRGVR